MEDYDKSQRFAHRRYEDGCLHKVLCCGKRGRSGGSAGVRSGSGWERGGARAGEGAGRDGREEEQEQAREGEAEEKEQGERSVLPEGTKRQRVARRQDASGNRPGCGRRRQGAEERGMGKGWGRGGK